MAGQRRAEILGAMADVVARKGLAEVTAAEVAAAAEVPRTLVFHYFKDRTGLVTAFIDEFVGSYGDRMFLAGDESPREKVHLAFGPGFYRSGRDLLIWLDLVALAGRDGRVRDRLRALWTERWLPPVAQLLRTAHPAATEAQADAVAYGLLCLIEAHWAFQAQGVDQPERTDQARAAATALLATLPG